MLNDPAPAKRGEIEVGTKKALLSLHSPDDAPISATAAAIQI
jgi:hypothetical protein